MSESAGPDARAARIEAAARSLFAHRTANEDGWVPCEWRADLVADTAELRAQMQSAFNDASHVLAAADAVSDSLTPQGARRIELRPDEAGLLDDVVVRDVKMFRLERMSEKQWWACCYLDDAAEERVDFWFNATRKDGLTAAVTDTPDPDDALVETPHGFVNRESAAAQHLSGGDER